MVARWKRLSMQIALPFALFVVIGSLVLVLWLLRRDERDSREAFRKMAEANAAFIVRSNLPPSEKLARDLSEVLEVDVSFGDYIAFHAGPGEVYVDNTGESIYVELSPGVNAYYSRPRPAFTGQLLRFSTLGPLAVFWGLSLVLALVISKRFVRPIHSLAEDVGRLDPGLQEALEFHGAPRPDEIGQLSRAFGEAHRRLVEERLRREEGERAALLGKMATGLAHEIRNPVAAVRLHAQLLADCERCGESGATIVSEADAIEELVNQWMFLSRPEPPEVSRQDVGGILEKCLDALAPAAQHAGVEVSRGIDGSLEGEVDSLRIGQAFRNITLNAIHAMPGGGTLRVEAQGDGEGLLIRFRDSGAGFTEEALERYGELFFSTKEGGMGVGLSVSSEIVSAHGGTLEVSNSEEGGAVVAIRLPANRKHSS